MRASGAIGRASDAVLKASGALLEASDAVLKASGALLEASDASRSFRRRRRRPSFRRWRA
jgi:hypothetical protein